MQIRTNQLKVSLFDLFVHKGASLGAFDVGDVSYAVQQKVDECVARSKWPDRYLVILTSGNRWIPSWAEKAPSCDPASPRSEDLPRCHSVATVREKLPDWVVRIFDYVDTHTFQLEHGK